MANLYCEKEITDRLALLRQQPEGAADEDPCGVRITCGILRLNTCRCDACNAPMSPGSKAMLVEFFMGECPPQKKYPGGYFKRRTVSEEIILYGVSDPAPCLCIEELHIPTIVCGPLEITALTRKDALLVCESSDLEVERLLIEFENEEAAESFERSMEYGAATVLIDPEYPSDEQTPGVKRVAVMHDHGVATHGFKGMDGNLRKWMDAYGFDGRGMLCVE